jgi:hypothetical protein
MTVFSWAWSAFAMAYGVQPRLKRVCALAIVAGVWRCRGVDDAPGGAVGAADKDVVVDVPPGPVVAEQPAAQWRPTVRLNHDDYPARGCVALEDPEDVVDHTSRELGDGPDDESP